MRKDSEVYFAYQKWCQKLSFHVAVKQLLHLMLYTVYIIAAHVYTAMATGQLI